MIDEASRLADDGCNTGCFIFSGGVREHRIDGQAIFSGAGPCNDSTHGGGFIGRLCHADGRRLRARPVHAERYAPQRHLRRRGDHLLLNDHLFDLKAFKPIAFERAPGRIVDFAVSASGQRLALLTPDGVLVFALEDQAARLHAVLPSEPGNAARALTFAGEDRLMIAGPVALTAVGWRDKTLRWRRKYPSVPEQARVSLGAGAQIVALRRGGRIQLIDASDGLPLSPDERVPALASDALVTVRVDAEQVVLHAETREWTRQLHTDTPADLAAIAMLEGEGLSRTRPLAEDVAAIDEETPRCVPGRALFEGECWPSAQVELMRRAIDQ